MKKYFTIALLTIIAAMQCFSQDIPTITFQNNGYYHDKPWLQNCEDTAGQWSAAEDTYPFSVEPVPLSQLYVTDTAITIYGLAGVFFQSPQYDSLVMYHFSIEDTCLEHTFDTLLLHDYDSTDAMSILRSARCGYIDPIVSHLYFPYGYTGVNGNTYNAVASLGRGMWYYANVYDNTPSGIYDVREVFFDSAIIIADSFYVAAQNHNLVHQRYNGTLPNRSFIMFLFSSSCMPVSNFTRNYMSSGQYARFIRFDSIPAMLGIFPILTPPVDTTGQGGDTTAVDMVDGVGRYVSLSPNPAADRVQVLSSFGLKQVEAYNAEGRLVYADEAHGLSKTIDLTAWPRGIYLVRVITPMGSTTKKLVLR